MSDDAKARVPSILRAVREGTADSAGELAIPDHQLAFSGLGWSDALDLDIEVPNGAVQTYVVDLDDGVRPSAIVAVLDDELPDAGVQVEHVLTLGSWDFALMTADETKVFTDGGRAALAEARPDLAEAAESDMSFSSLRHHLTYVMMTPPDEDRPVLHPARIARAAPDAAPALLTSPFTERPFRAHGARCGVHLAVDDAGRRALVLDFGASVAALLEGQLTDDPFDGQAGRPLETTLQLQDAVEGVWSADDPDDPHVERTIVTNWTGELQQAADSPDEGVGIYSFGSIRAPSGTLVIADPRARDVVDHIPVEIPPERDLPVYGTVHEHRPSGLLLRLANGTPTSWVPAVTDHGVWQGIDAGVVALMDSRSREITDDSNVGLAVAFGTADLTDTGRPTLAWLTDIGGDVPVGALVGLNTDGHAVAVLIDAEIPRQERFASLGPDELSADDTDAERLRKLAASPDLSVHTVRGAFGAVMPDAINETTAENAMRVVERLAKEAWREDLPEEHLARLEGLMPADRLTEARMELAFRRREPATVLELDEATPGSEPLRMRRAHMVASSAAVVGDPEAAERAAAALHDQSGEASRLVRGAQTYALEGPEAAWSVFRDIAGNVDRITAGVTPSSSGEEGLRPDAAVEAAAMRIGASSTFGQAISSLDDFVPQAAILLDAGRMTQTPLAAAVQVKRLMSPIVEAYPSTEQHYLGRWLIALYIAAGSWDAALEAATSLAALGLHGVRANHLGALIGPAVKQGRLDDLAPLLAPHNETGLRTVVACALLAAGEDPGIWGSGSDDERARLALSVASGERALADVPSEHRSVVLTFAIDGVVAAGDVGPEVLRRAVALRRGDLVEQLQSKVEIDLDLLPWHRDVLWLNVLDRAARDDAGTPSQVVGVETSMQLEVALMRGDTAAEEIAAELIS